MLAQVENYFLLFFNLSILGWCLEVACKLVQFRRFINRGFLIGPYCPIYGVGSVLITVLLSRFSSTPIAVFLMAMIVCGVLEYITSYAMEKLFHARWWDYSNRRFNIDGRVCANTLIPFGLLALLLVYVIKPFLFDLFARIPSPYIHVLCAALLAVILSDIVISANVLGKIRKSATHVSGIDDTESLTRSVREHLSQHGLLVRRALLAFPYMKLYNSEVLRAMHDRQQKLRREAEEHRRRLREEFESFAQKIHEYKSKSQN